MGIHEMHIAIDIWLQKINSNFRRDILPEEKDFVLNSVIQNYVSSKIRQDRSRGEFGAFNDEIDSDAISTLLVQFKPLSVFPSSKPGFYEVRTPSDYRNFVSLTGITVPINCMTDQEKSLPRTETTTDYLYIFKIPALSGAGPFYEQIKLNWAGEEMTVSSKGTSDPELSRFVFNAIQDAEWPEGVKEIYWQKYPTRLEQKNHLIISSHNKLAVEPTLTLNGALIPSVFVEKTEQRVNRNNAYKTTVSAPSRRIKPQYFETIKQSSFERSTFRNLAISAEDDIILIPTDENFIVTIAALSYVRKPKEVSLSLGIDCDLPDSSDVHDYICQKAAEELLLSVDSPSWQARFETNKLKK